MSERSARDVVDDMSWTFIHLWRRVADGKVVEHWACRDDMGLLDQVRTDTELR